MNPQELTLIAAVARAYGRRVEGGYLLLIPETILASIRPNGIISTLPPDHREPGLRILYTPEEMTIDGGKMEFIKDEPLSPPQPDYPVLESPVAEPVTE
jgi:hypothetical protein